MANGNNKNSATERADKRKQALNRIKSGDNMYNIGGVSVNSSRSPEIFNILRGTQALVKKRYGAFDNKSNSVNRHAMSLLDFLGATVCMNADMKQMDFSLLDNQTDDTIIDNPNIEQDFSGLKSELKNLKDKFKNVDDPIYVLDDEVPYMVQAQIKDIRDTYTIPDVRLITSDIVVYNMDIRSVPTLNYFK